MRLGGPVFGDNLARDPNAWIGALRAENYRAAYCPLGEHADEAIVRAFADTATRADIVIAEVGAWSNPLSPDDETRKTAIALCQARLDLADRIGARCCVNIAGSRGEKWDGPHPDDLTEDTFDMIVETVRAIIDAVRPTRTVYALETMPWMYPDSSDSYLRLLQAIDRPGQFGVHLDPVNLVNSPERFFRNADLLRDCFVKLGPHLVGVHAKDIALRPNLTVHLDEVRPGEGGLDYPIFLAELSRLDPDIPVMLEHLPGPNEYRLAADHVRAVATNMGYTL